MSCRVVSPIQAGQTSSGRETVWRMTVPDIARALASIAGVKALSDYDAGLTDGYINKAEALLELAIEFAHERHRGDC